MNFKNPYFIYLWRHSSLTGHKRLVENLFHWRARNYRGGESVASNGSARNRPQSTNFPVAVGSLQVRPPKLLTLACSRHCLQPSIGEKRRRNGSANLSAGNVIYMRQTQCLARIHLMRNVAMVVVNIICIKG